MQPTKPASWPWWFWTLIILGIILIAPSAGRFVLNIATRGKRLTHTTLDDNGDCTTSIEDCVAQANATEGIDTIDDQQYSLARMFASEGESYSTATKVAIGWVAVNVARSRGQTVTELLTADRNAHGNGKYGKQSGRWASTAFDPYEQDILIAASILAGDSTDPTNGAVHYFEETLQDELLKLGKVNSSAAQIEAAWSDETGNPGFKIAGVDSRLTFFSPNGAPA
jgi:hypothetical protein